MFPVVLPPIVPLLVIPLEIVTLSVIQLIEISMPALLWLLVTAMLLPALLPAILPLIGLQPAVLQKVSMSYVISATMLVVAALVKTVPAMQVLTVDIIVAVTYSSSGL